MTHEAIECGVSGIKCDAAGCDYHDDGVKFENYQDWLNKPCPTCGSNLLTQVDFDQARALFAMVGAINDAIGPIEGDAPDVKPIRVSFDGNGISNIVIAAWRDSIADKP